MNHRFLMLATLPDTPDSVTNTKTNQTNHDRP